MAEKNEILITVPFSQDHLAELQAAAGELHVRFQSSSEGHEITDETWKGVEILYTLKDLPSLHQSPNLRWIQFHFAGVEEHLDAPIFSKDGLQATTLSGANSPQVAEHALALMLALSHHIPQMLADQQQNLWSPNRLAQYIPNELLGSTVGIVGYGSVGQRLARLLQSFGVTILASKRDLLRPSGDGFQVDGQGDPEGSLVRRLYPAKALRSMLKECDYVVVTVPLTAETRGMLGVKQLSAMKPSAFLIDVSRGGVVDQAALLQALNKRQLGGAGLDVFPEEPLPADSPLWDLPNVIVSPHVAGLSPYYMDRAFALFKENLRRYLAGESLRNKIDLARGY